MGTRFLSSNERNAGTKIEEIRRNVLFCNKTVSPTATHAANNKVDVIRDQRVT